MAEFCSDYTFFSSALYRAKWILRWSQAHGSILKSAGARADEHGRPHAHKPGKTRHITMGAGCVSNELAQEIKKGGYRDEGAMGPAGHLASDTVVTPR